MDTTILSSDIPVSTTRPDRADSDPPAPGIAGAIAQRLARAVGPRRYAMWFDRSARFDYQPQPPTLTVVAPNRFVGDWIKRHFTQPLTDAAREQVGQDVSLELRVDPGRFDSGAAPGPSAGAGGGKPRADAPFDCASTSAPADAAPRAAPAPRRGSAPRGGYDAIFNSGPMRHRLDRFITGPSNDLAYAAAVRIADPRLDAAHPVFLHGDCGLGKTHLLQGACRAMRDADPGAKVVYTTGEHFTNQYIHAVRHNRLDAFRKRIRRLDLLAVDDVHFIANKQATQQEFLHSFDEIDLGGSRVILASDSHPRLIEQFSEALVSRCVRGLVVEVRTPDAPMRQKLIQSLAHRRGLTLQDAAAASLARGVAGSIRELEGALTKLQAMLSLTPDANPAAGGRAKSAEGAAIGHAAIDRLLGHCSRPGRGPRKPLRFEAILSAVCENVGVEPAQVLGPARHRQVVLARSLAVHMARELTAMSYPEIARAMGRKNHSTVITAAQRLGRQLESNTPVHLPARRDPIAPRDLAAQVRRDLEQPTP